jgi:hypothetical protein
MSARCTKEFTLVVTGDSCGIFDFAWNTPDLYPGDPAGSVSASETQCNFIYTIGSAQWPEFSPFIPYISNHGEFTYTGPAKSCHLHLVVTRDALATADGVSYITIKVDSVVVLYQTTLDTVSNVYDFDFSIPLSDGALVEVDVIVSLSASPFSLPSSVVFNGTFSVNP